MCGELYENCHENYHDYAGLRTVDTGKDYYNSRVFKSINWCILSRL